MPRRRKRRSPSRDDSISDENIPKTKRIKISKLDVDSVDLSDDNTISTTSGQDSQSDKITPSPHLPASNMIDLGIEFPSLPQVLINNNNPQNEELCLDNEFDFGCLDSNTFPMIFNWNELRQATNPQQLRSDALRKQERGKYVRRDSLSSEQAADRRRRQNRESARRTRYRVRKYITVLEMYYSHVQNVNNLLIKQLEIMAKYCSNQLSDDERKQLKIHSWPKPPTIQQCLNAKPATVSATNNELSPMHTTNNKQRKKENNPIKHIHVLNSLSLPKINLPPPQQPMTGTNVLNQIQAINNNVNNMPSNPLQAFERELLQCGVSLNVNNPLHVNRNRMSTVNPQRQRQPHINSLPNGQLLIDPNGANMLSFQRIPNMGNNIVTLQLPPTQFNNFNSYNNINNINMVNENR